MQFSAETPYLIAVRYNAGDISRDRMVSELIAFPYVKNEAWETRDTDWDSIGLPDTPGSFTDVARAFHAELIAMEDYEEIFNAVETVNNQHD